MVGPKYQHWVPCAYLKHFAIEGRLNGRNSRVYVTTINNSIDAKVEKTGGSNWTYSRANPLLDHEFNDMENNWPELVKKLRAGETLSASDRILLSLTVFDLHHRSAAYTNNTSTERFPAYEKVSRTFLDLIVPGHIDKTNLLAMRNALAKNWDMRTVVSTSGAKFITSDHPSVIFTDEATSKPILALLPITPVLCVLVFKVTKIRINRVVLTDKEIGTLNGLQAKRCISKLYSDYDLYSEEDNVIIKKLLSKPRPKRYFEEETYRPDYYPMNSHNFSILPFLKTL